MKNRKGLTLIEVIISIALITIISVTILSTFNISVTNIIKSGKRTERVLNTKGKIDQEIKNKEGSTGIKEVKVILPGGIEKIIEGNIIEEKNLDDPNIKMTTFIPNK